MGLWEMVAGGRSLKSSVHDRKYIFKRCTRRACNLEHSHGLFMFCWLKFILEVLYFILTSTGLDALSLPINCCNFTTKLLVYILLYHLCFPQSLHTIKWIFALAILCLRSLYFLFCPCSVVWDLQVIAVHFNTPATIV